MLEKTTPNKMRQKYSVEWPIKSAKNRFIKIINGLKALLESKIRENLGLREKVEFLKISSEMFDIENRRMKDQLRESEDEKTSLLRLVDLSNNLIANYEDLIHNYKTNLESFKKELDASKVLNESLNQRKKYLEEIDEIKQSEIDSLRFRCKEETKAKKFYFRSYQKLMTLFSRNEKQIQFYEDHIVNIESQIKM